MRRALFVIYSLNFLACTQDDNSSRKSDLPGNDSAGRVVYEVTNNTYINPGEADSSFTIGHESFKVVIRRYERGDYYIADTNGTRISLFQENFIDIIINDKITTISKSLFADHYDQNTLYHSCFGNFQIDSIDKTNRKIILGTFFGYHQSDHGEWLKYAISLDGKFEFKKIEEVEFGEEQ